MPRKSKSSGDSSRDSKGARDRRARAPHVRTITSGDVLGVLADEPLGWRELVHALERANPLEIKQLRLLLRGLERTGEVERDHTGAYHAVGRGPRLSGVVEEHFGELYVNGVKVENARRQRLRAGDQVVANVVDGRARIIDVEGFSSEPLIGILHWHGRYPHVESLSRSYKGRVALLDMPSRDSGIQDGDVVSVRVLDSDRRGLVGRLLEVLHSDSVVELAVTANLRAFGIPSEWPDAVEAAVGKLPRSVAGDRYPARTDLRALPLVTIDGETAKDFDDAVFGEALDDGFRLVVAIADVGHYVKPGSSLDLEAEVRGTSVYFPGRVVPMLPEALSNELCSLKPEVPRLAMACDMRVSASGTVEEFSFYEAVIRSHARLTYTAVQRFLDGAGDLPVDGGEDAAAAVARSVRALDALRQAFRGARDRRGGLDFETREGAVSVLEGKVVAVEPVVRLPAHQLIEEAMIAANVAAAEFLESHDALSLYRVHEKPDLLKLDELRQALALAGVQLPSGSTDPKQLQQALAALHGHPNAWLFEQLVLRSLPQAIYSPNNQGHFGLALRRYMHFTSPIRRYPDLLVHRAIKRVLGTKKDQRYLPELERLQQLGEQCSTTERRAEAAGWAVDAWLKCDLLKARVGETLQGLVAGVTEFGLFVEIAGYFVQGLLHVSELGTDYYHHHPATASLVGERTGKRYGLGDVLEVLVFDVDPPQGRIDLRLPGASSGGGGRRQRRRARRG